jgi:hypothetical protein
LTSLPLSKPVWKPAAASLARGGGLFISDVIERGSVSEGGTMTKRTRLEGKFTVKEGGSAEIPFLFFESGPGVTVSLRLAVGTTMDDAQQLARHIGQHLEAVEVRIPD